MKIPIIADGWVVRGTKELPRLYHLNTNKTILLNTEILKYILECDGRNSLDYFSEKYGLDLKIVNGFFDKFVDAGAVVYTEYIKDRVIDCKLGRKEPWLKEVHIDITNNCNLRCRHCFWGENLSTECNIPFSMWKDFIKDLSEAGVGRVVLSGGEAFTNNDLFNFVKECISKNIMVASIFTNGTIMDEKIRNIVAYLIEQRLETAFYISLDGKNEEQHDFIRGNGNFKKTLDFICYLLKEKKENQANYKILINSLIHKKNKDGLIEWYDFLQELGVDGWRFTTGRVSGFLKTNRDEIKVSSVDCFDEYEKLIKYAIEKYNNKDDMYINVENFFNTRYLRNGKAYLFNGDLEICDYKAHALSVDPKGNVQFCTGWQSIKYGNVFTENIEDIWYSEKMQSMKKFKINNIIECNDCKYLKYCGGGCRLECKDLYSKDESLCDSFEMFDRKIVPILRDAGIDFVD